MRDPAFRQVKSFLAVHWRPGAPVLLACSGGPDSKALLYLLIKAQKIFAMDLQVAHVDHGWREESLREAEELRQEVEGLGFKFHLRSLKDLPAKEGVAREARYDQLRQIAGEIGAQAVLLAHQMEDQAETVLKRVLEGASIPSCGGMKEVSGLLWRPLLTVSKKELMTWLEKRKISYFTDPTNLDSKYLRGRMRTSIIPQLEASFGKSIVKNLCLLGERAQKIEEYFRNQTREVQNASELEGPLLEFFLKAESQKQGNRFSRDELQVLVRKIKK